MSKATSKSKPPTVLWFRRDLRLADNPALRAAMARGGPVIPVYIWAPEEEGDWPPGAASRWWLHHSLASLNNDLERAGSRLIVCRGVAGSQASSLEVLLQMVEATGAQAVYWNRRYEPAAIARDSHVKQALTQREIDAKSFNGNLLLEPWDIQNKTGGPYQVFSQYWRNCLARGEPRSLLPGVRKLPGGAAITAKQRAGLKSLQLAELELLPQRNWAAGLAASWQPGEAGARKQLRRFTAEALGNYQDGRNRPDQPGSSRLSPHLHFGELSPQQVWHAAVEANRPVASKEAAASCETYLSELGWREFGYHLLYHFPHTTGKPLRTKFEDFPWQPAACDLQAWQRGLTGYPLVDAGMRELWATGWMHNRVRMVVASFLTKDLLIPWQTGAQWFWDTLVDADLASNTLGWQWTAGCGADAAPYFRVFNPVSQGKKFDPDGNYVARWVPELANLPPRYRHQPWEASQPLLAEAGVMLGSGPRDDRSSASHGQLHVYPHRIVDHGEARKAALAAYRQI